jgi:hypothetical protein
VLKHETDDGTCEGGKIGRYSSRVKGGLFDVCASSIRR